MSEIASGRGARFLQVAAYLVIVIAGLKAAAGLVGQILLAALIAVALIRPIRNLQRFGVPEFVAVPLIVLVATGAIAMIVAAVGASAVQFQAELPELSADVREFVSGVLTDIGLSSARVEQINSVLEPGDLFRLIGDTVTQLLGALSDLVVLILLVLFVLFESSALPRKLRVAFGASVLDNYEVAIRQVHGYLSVKTGVSLLTGILAGASCALLEVGFPVLWGLVAFAFNFVPNIGSLIAAIPPVLLALITVGPGTAAMVAAAYTAINVAIGYLVEPRVMGRQLGLNTLVVFLSLILWAWVFGPIGMLLSVPLTAILKIMLENTDDLRGVAILLGPAPVAEAADADSR